MGIAFVVNIRLTFLTTLIISLSSFGSNAKEWSGPGNFLFIVKCFSITDAPYEIDRSGAIIGSTL